MKSFLGLSLVVCLVLMVGFAAGPAVAKASPDQPQIADKNGDDGAPAGFSWNPDNIFNSLVAAPNCTWTCTDGRTGSAEVKNKAACQAACAAACEEPCVVN